MSNRNSLVLRLVKGFGRFWWDFLIGDTPELFVAALVIIGSIAGLRGAGNNTVAVIALPVLVVCALSVSIRRAINTAKKK